LSSVFTCKLGASWFAREGTDGHRHFLQALRALLRRDDDLLDLRDLRCLLRQRRADRDEQSAQETPDRIGFVHVVLSPSKR
jgi:hypothetical protein